MTTLPKSLVNRNLSFLINSSNVLRNYSEKRNKEFGFKAYGNELLKIQEKIGEGLQVTYDESIKLTSLLI